jgi:aerobic-type carbon monoxide dehydrogenase small subunit (CoxS/CutS family)
MTQPNRITVRRVPPDLAVPGERSLPEVLREDLRLPGANPGRGEDACRACMVLSKPTPSATALDVS